MRQLRPTTAPGGADKFLAFLEKELDPLIRSRYNAKPGPAGILGDSFGGTFTFQSGAGPLSIVLLLQIIWDLRVFAQVRLLQDSGAPVSETNLLGNFIFELGIGRQDFGGAAAVSIFVLVLTVLLSWPYVRSLMKELA